MSTNERTAYEILGLTQSSGLTPQDLRQAYHQTLLLNHPDKSKPTSQAAHTASVDEITKAYTQLSDPVKRKSYDRDLSKLQRLNRDSGKTFAYLATDSYDLDELRYSVSEEGRQIWSKECRCGNSDGYVVTEEDLESASVDVSSNNRLALPEVFVPCHGCSLVIRVTFDIA